MIRRLARVAETGLGVLLALTPVALWVAWTPEILIAVLIVSVVSAGLLVLLTEPSSGEVTGRVVLPDEFIDDVHRLFPLTYHHSLGGGPSRFRRTMKKLSALIR